VHNYIFIFIFTLYSHILHYYFTLFHIFMDFHYK